MKAFEVRRMIAATPGTIWGILTDAQMLQSNDLGILKIEGAIAPGSRIRLWSEVSPKRAFALEVTELTPMRRMVWSGGMPFGLFTGRRQFNLTGTDAGTEFHMREEFTGPLSGLIAKSVPDLTPSFERFAEGLGRLAEGTNR